MFKNVKNIKKEIIAKFALTLCLLVDFFEFLFEKRYKTYRYFRMFQIF